MRIRTIKPEFFLHDKLYDAEAESGLPLRVAFIGLWCVADREGRFRWEPRRVGAAILPYDKVDFSRVLDALTARGFIVKYSVKGEWFGAIPSFTRHQVINNREAASACPDYSENDTQIDACPTRAPRVVDACPTRESGVPHACPTAKSGREWKGMEGMEGKGVSADGEAVASGSVIEMFPFDSKETPESKPAQAKRAASKPEDLETSEHRKFMDAWKSAYVIDHGVEYLFSGAKDGSAAKALLKTGLTAAELIEIVRKAWRHPERFECKQSVTIAGFSSRFNQIRAELNTIAGIKPAIAQQDRPPQKIIDGVKIGGW